MNHKRKHNLKIADKRKGFVLLPASVAFATTVLFLAVLFSFPVQKTASLVNQRVWLSSASNLANAGSEKALNEIEKEGPGFSRTAQVKQELERKMRIEKKHILPEIVVCN